MALRSIQSPLLLSFLISSLLIILILGVDKFLPDNSQSEGERARSNPGIVSEPSVSSDDPLNDELFAHFAIIDESTALVSLGLADPRFVQTFSFSDPASGERLFVTDIRHSIGAYSETLSGQVVVGGQARPATVTFGTEAVFLSLPYSKGVLRGEGPLVAQNIELTLNKPYQDYVVRDTNSSAPIRSEQEPERPQCVNC